MELCGKQTKEATLKVPGSISTKARTKLVDGSGAKRECSRIFLG